MKNKPSNTVYISNLSYKRDRSGLKTLFSRYGVIKNIKIIVEPETGQSRGMAFVEMASIKEATAAIDGMNGQVIDGRTVKANYAIPQKPEAIQAEKIRKLSDPKPKAKGQDRDYKEIQLAKKERNLKKRTANPLQFKKAGKKVAKKASKK